MMCREHPFLVRMDQSAALAVAFRARPDPNPYISKPYRDVHDYPGLLLLVARALTKLYTSHPVLARGEGAQYFLLAVRDALGVPRCQNSS